MKTLSVSGIGELTERGSASTDEITFPVRIFAGKWHVIEDEFALADLVWEIGNRGFRDRKECDFYVKNFVKGGSKLSTAQKARHSDCLFTAMNMAC